MLCDIKLIWKDFFELYYVVALLKLHFVPVKKLHLVITQRRTEKMSFWGGFFGHDKSSLVKFACCASEELLKEIVDILWNVFLIPLMCICQINSPPTGVHLASQSCFRFLTAYPWYESSFCRIPKGLRSGDRGSRLSTVNTCSREQFEMAWVLWHGAVSWCKQSPGDGHIGHKGMDIVSYTTEAGCDI